MIPGVTLSGTSPCEAPVILVIAREKTGKSTLATTLKNWPQQGAEPLVLAFDKTGPDSCARIGMPVYNLKVADQPGARMEIKMQATASLLETHFSNGKKPYSSIVIDCASTMADKLFDEAMRFSKNPDPRSHYGDVLRATKSFFYRLLDLGVPTVWVGWLREPETSKEGGVTRFKPGGVQIMGQFRETLAGKAHAIVLLEKVAAAAGDPNASSDGFTRRFHTRPHGGINCESRYALPPIMPAHLGWLLHYVINGYQEPSQATGT